MGQSVSLRRFGSSPCIESGRVHHTPTAPLAEHDGATDSDAFGSILEGLPLHCTGLLRGTGKAYTGPHTTHRHRHAHSQQPGGAKAKEEGGRAGLRASVSTESLTGSSRKLVAGVRVRTPQSDYKKKQVNRCSISIDIEEKPWSLTSNSTRWTADEAWLQRGPRR